MWNSKNYANWLRNRLNEVKDSLDFSQYEIEVINEQDFAKRRSIKPNTITVIVKCLKPLLVFNVTTSQPIQMIIIGEENGIDVTQTIMNRFAGIYNNYVQAEGGNSIKHAYATPVVLSNFNLIGIGYRTALYMDTNLFILENSLDIGNYIIWYKRNIQSDTGYDLVKVPIISATFAYTMQGDTQPFSGKLAKTVRDFATFTMTITIPATQNELIAQVVKIMTGGDEIDTFKLSVDFGEEGHTLETNFPLEMKLVDATISSAINNVPSIQLSFSV